MAQCKITQIRVCECLTCDTLVSSPWSFQRVTLKPLTVNTVSSDQGSHGQATVVIGSELALKCVFHVNSKQLDFDHQQLMNESNI